MKKYKFADPETNRNKMIEVLVKALKRDLTDLEIRKICWLSNCEYETAGVILDLFKELASKKED